MKELNNLITAFICMINIVIRAAYRFTIRIVYWYFTFDTNTDTHASVSVFGYSVHREKYRPQKIMIFLLHSNLNIHIDSIFITIDILYLIYFLIIFRTVGYKMVCLLFWVQTIFHIWNSPTGNTDIPRYAKTFEVFDPFSILRNESR